MCEGVKMAEPDISFSVLNLMEVWDEVDLNEYDKYFDAVYSDKKVSLRSGSLADYIKIIIKGASSFLKGEGLKKSFGKPAIIRYFKGKYLDNLFRKHDVINFHYLDEYTYEYVKNIQPNNKVVCSFWGSDLLVEESKAHNEAVSKLVNLADAITTHTDFHKDVILKKYGEHLKPKIHKALFGLSHRHVTKLQEIVENDKADLSICQLIKDEYGTDVNTYKHIIRVGYNGNTEQNHIPVIESLKKSENKEDILLLVPMSYGLATDEYKAEVRKALEQSGFNHLIIEKYLSEQHAFELGKLCNIAIMVRDTDALNNALIEELMAGSFVVAGSWLPYRVLSNEGIYFEEVYNFDVLDKVSAYINNVDGYKAKLANNGKILADFISNKRNGKHWAAAFKSVVQE